MFVCLLYVVFIGNAASIPAEETDVTKPISGVSGPRQAANETTDVSDWMSEMKEFVEKNNEKNKEFINKNNEENKEFINKKINDLEEDLVSRLRPELMTSPRGGEPEASARRVEVPVVVPPVPEPAPELTPDQKTTIQDLKTKFGEITTKLRSALGTATTAVTEYIGPYGATAQLSKNVQKVTTGLQNSVDSFDHRIGVAETTSSNAERVSILTGLKSLVLEEKVLWDNIREKHRSERPHGTRLVPPAKDLLTAASESIDNFKTMIDPSKTWQERTTAGLNIASKFVAFLPSPVGDIGSVVLGFVAGCFGASAPTTNEYKQLRNQILEGVKNLLDETQKAEAMGCIFKIEFLKGLLEINVRDVMTDKEFYAIILAGGIDVGVSIIGTFKYKMETYRDKNTIQSGRDALDMAQMYVKVAKARDMLQQHIIEFIEMGDSGSKSKSGLTSQFFLNTQALAERDYQHLFWWEDLCCEKNPKHFSALLAYNVPIGKHAGKDNAVDELSKFIKDYRTVEYYSNTEMSDDTRLSYDSVSGSGANKVYSPGKRRPEVDTSWYYYNSNGSSSYYVGIANPAWYVFISTKNYHGIDLICDARDDPKRYTVNFGVSTYESKLRFTPSPDLGNPRTGKLDLVYNDYDYYVGSTSVFKKNLPKLLKTFGETEHVTSGGGFVSAPTKYNSAIVSCKNSAPAVVDVEEAPGGLVDWKTVFKEAKIRVFKVSFKNSSNWIQPKYIISPVVEYEPDEETLYLVTQDSTSYPLSKDIPKPASDEEKEKPLKPDYIATEAKWKEVWFKQKFQSVFDEIDEEFVCPKENGKCSTSDGTVPDEASDKMTKVASIEETRVEEYYSACLASCRKHSGATGCEAREDSVGILSCYVHTSPVAIGNGELHIDCWVFSKCKAPSPTPPTRPDHYILDERIHCLVGCGSNGGSCPGICGTGGSCCKRGKPDCSEVMQAVSLYSHYTCIKKAPSALASLYNSVVLPMVIADIVTSGSCKSVSKEDCFQYAKDRKKKHDYTTHYPPGCYFKTKGSTTTEVYYNPSESNAECTAVRTCICQNGDNQEDITSGRCTSVSEDACDEIAKSRTPAKGAATRGSKRPPGCYKYTSSSTGDITYYYNDISLNRASASCSAGRTCICKKPDAYVLDPVIDCEEACKPNTANLKSGYCPSVCGFNGYCCKKGVAESTTSCGSVYTKRVDAPTDHYTCIKIRVALI